MIDSMAVMGNLEPVACFSREAVEYSKRSLQSFATKETNPNISTENMYFIVVISIPFWMGVLLLKYGTNQDIKNYIFDRTTALILTLYSLVIFLVFYSQVISFIGSSPLSLSKGVRSAVFMFLIYPGVAASLLIFGRAYTSDHQPSLIDKSCRFLAWAYLIIMACSLATRVLH